MATTAPRPSDLEAPHGGLRFDEYADEDLARRVAKADETAFAALYERHYQALYRYCRSIVRDDLDAQDALQTAWTRALVALRQGRRDAPVRPWLYRIVHNEAISLLRRRRRGPEPTEALAHGDAGGSSPQHGVPSAEESAIARERFALLMSDLGRLPERPRGALLMREVSGLSHEEIAVALQTSVAAAKQCIYEARRDLAELAAGRAAPCDDICRSISGGDRRALRARRVKAHLSDCPSCASFASAIDDRRRALHAALPWLAAPAAITLLDSVLRSASGTVSSAGAGAAAGGSAGAAAGGSAGAAAPMATAGTAGPAAVAGGVVTKAVGASLLGKAALAAAALTAGALSLGGMGMTSGGASQRAPVAHRPTASVARGHRSAARLAAPVSAPGPHGRTTAAGHAVGLVGSGRVRQASGALPRGQVKKASGALAPGQVKKASGMLAPGQVKKASGTRAPGRAKKASGSVAAGHANQASGSAAPGQAKRASGTPAPGQAKKTSGSLAAGHANHSSSSVAPGRANKGSSGQANKGSSGQATTASSSAATGGQASTASSGVVAPGQVKRTATGSSVTTPSAASVATGASGHARAK